MWEKEETNNNNMSFTALLERTCVQNIAHKPYSSTAYFKCKPLKYVHNSDLYKPESESRLQP